MLFLCKTIVIKSFIFHTVYNNKVKRDISKYTNYLKARYWSQNKSFQKLYSSKIRVYSNKKLSKLKKRKKYINQRLIIKPVSAWKTCDIITLNPQKSNFLSLFQVFMLLQFHIKNWKHIMLRISIKLENFILGPFWDIIAPKTPK